MPSIPGDCSAGNAFGSYELLTMAKVACISDKTCIGVVDEGCGLKWNTFGAYRICKKGFRNPSDSCIHLKKDYNGMFIYQWSMTCVITPIQTIQMIVKVLTFFTDKHGSTCIDIHYRQFNDERSDSYTWQFGRCHASHQNFGNGRYTDRCCIPNGDHIFSCTNNQGNGWHNAVVKIGRHQFCDDVVGYKKLIKLNIPGRILDALFYLYIVCSI